MKVNTQCNQKSMGHSKSSHEMELCSITGLFQEERKISDSPSLYIEELEKEH